jgi:Mn-dependent DtxR family transcriptional regulator
MLGKGQLTPDDCKTLALMDTEPTVLSIEVARLFGPWNRTATLKANAMLARLQRRGLVCREPYRPGCYSQWRITDAGRQAVAL